MVWKRFKNQTNDEILQNRFTSYLQSAMRRERALYLAKLNILNNQIDYDGINEESSNFDLESEVLKKFPIHLQIQNEKLFLSIAELSNQEQYVFFQRVLGELSLEEMAEELGISYNAVAATYYRAVRKLKNKMQGE